MKRLVEIASEDLPPYCPSIEFVREMLEFQRSEREQAAAELAAAQLRQEQLEREAVERREQARRDREEQQQLAVAQVAMQAAVAALATLPADSRVNKAGITSTLPADNHVNRSATTGSTSHALSTGKSKDLGHTISEAEGDVGVETASSKNLSVDGLKKNTVDDTKNISVDSSKNLSVDDSRKLSVDSSRHISVDDTFDARSLSSDGIRTRSQSDNIFTTLFTLPREGGLDGHVDFPGVDCLVRDVPIVYRRDACYADLLVGCTCHSMTPVCDRL